MKGVGMHYRMNGKTLGSENHIKEWYVLWNKHHTSNTHFTISTLFLHPSHLIKKNNFTFQFPTTFFSILSRRRLFHWWQQNQKNINYSIIQHTLTTCCSIVLTFFFVAFLSFKTQKFSLKFSFSCFFLFLFFSCWFRKFSSRLKIFHGEFFILFLSLSFSVSV